MTKKILTTQPIRDKEKIKEMKETLKRDRDRIIFLLGINSGLRSIVTGKQIGRAHV